MTLSLWPQDSITLPNAPGSQQMTYKGHKAAVTACHYFNGILFTGSQDLHDLSPKASP